MLDFMSLESWEHRLTLNIRSLDGIIQVLPVVLWVQFDGIYFFFFCIWNMLDVYVLFDRNLFQGTPYPQQDQNAIDAVLQFAIHKLGFKPENILLFGWSIGGYSSLVAAVQYPEIKGVVCHPKSNIEKPKQYIITNVCALCIFKKKKHDILCRCSMQHSMMFCI